MSLPYARSGEVHCMSRLASKTEYGQPYWPTCDLIPGHGGNHYSGHFQDVMWVWTDDQAMTPEQVAAWQGGAA